MRVWRSFGRSSARTVGRFRFWRGSWRCPIGNGARFTARLLRPRFYGSIRRGIRCVAIPRFRNSARRNSTEYSQLLHRTETPECGIRMAGLYLVGAWLLTQVASTVLPMFGAPDWLPRTVVILLAIGFVPALIFSWVFELTPEGLKRDEKVPPEQSIAPQTARRMDRMIMVV